VNKSKLPSVYNYSNYRLYLHDYYTARRLENSTYSHRQMAKELGFPSPNFIKLVIDGIRNVGLRSIDRLLQGLRINEKEQNYLQHLIFFSQARTSVEKNYYYGLMYSLRPPAMIKTISTDAYRYYSEWFHCVVRELIVREKAPFDFQTISRKIRPHITVTQLKKSIELLSELGFIRKNESGNYEHASRIIATDREVVSVGIRNYHQKMIDLAKDSIDSVSRDKREISSLTLSISPECGERIKKRIQEFEDEILKMVQDEKNAASIYQLNFQFFPLVQEDA
jgi:uncharacterized protein (TIGR02147 family)